MVVDRTGSKQIEFYDTAAKGMVDLDVSSGQIGMYTCGPTVYKDAHIGNMRAYVTADLVRRAIDLAGGEVIQVINITDVGHLTSDADLGDDKVAKSASETGKSAWDIAKEYEETFWQDYDTLRLKRPGVVARATDHIDEQVALVQELERAGVTYTTDDGVYFDSSLFPAYAEFARLSLSGQSAGTRVDLGQKKHPSDFALWKFPSRVGRREMEWNSPWGIGFPGWHIECSAMAMKYLGSEFAIHTGGIDHIPVHHTNEIAQARAAGYPFAKHWVHTAFLLDDMGEKMSKSSGLSSRLPDVVSEYGVTTDAMRYLYLTSHYRQPLPFSGVRLLQANTALQGLTDAVAILEKTAANNEDTPNQTQIKSSLWDRFTRAVTSDFNTPQAVDIMHEATKAKIPPFARVALLASMDRVLDLGITSKIGDGLILTTEQEHLLGLRDEARGVKDYAAADALRTKLSELHGIRVIDSPLGQVIRKV